MLVDPHTAVGIGVLEKLQLHGKTIVLATAHPSKFYETVLSSSGVKPELPEKLQNIYRLDESYDKLPCDFDQIKDFIFKKCK